MPFGLTSVPNTWTRLVTAVMQNIPKIKLTVFFDDLLIHSPTLEEHLGTLKTVLTAVSQSGLLINLEKSDWINTEVKFLGHIITADGVTVPPEFSQIIRDWPLPQTLKQLRSFLGKCNYYRSHFEDFGKVASLLMEHLKGSTESSRKLDLTNDPKAVKSFEALKQLLISPQFLAYPDFNSHEKFILDTDYSNSGNTVVVSQVQNGPEKPIAYNARKLKSSESQYASYKGELLALIFGINSYKFFLTAKPFLVRTDNNALSRLKSQKDSKGMLKRWLRILSTYDFDVIHSPGTQHANADALSRANLSETEATELLEDDQILTMGASLLDDLQSISSDDSDVDIEETTPSDQTSRSSNVAVPAGLVQQQQSDRLLRKVREWVHSEQKPTGLEYKALNANEKQYVDIFETLRIDDKGVLQRCPLDSTSKVSKPCIPSSLQNKVIQVLYAKNQGGGNALANAVQSWFYFPRLVTVSHQYIFQCP